MEVWNRRRNPDSTAGNMLAAGIMILLTGFFSFTAAAQEPLDIGLEKGRRHVFLVDVNYFHPGAESMRELYGGGPSFGAEINLRLWKSLRFWLSGNVFSVDGSLPITGDQTKMNLSVIESGLILKPLSGSISPYLGAGAGICIYKETNPIGAAEGNEPGWIGRAGFHFQPAEFILFDLGILYSKFEAQPQRIKADLGGLQVRLGLGFTF